MISRGESKPVRIVFTSHFYRQVSKTQKKAARFLRGRLDAWYSASFAHHFHRLRNCRSDICEPFLDSPLLLGASLVFCVISTYFFFFFDFSLCCISEVFFFQLGLPFFFFFFFLFLSLPSYLHTQNQAKRRKAEQAKAKQCSAAFYANRLTDTWVGLGTWHHAVSELHHSLSLIHRGKNKMDEAFGRGIWGGWGV